MLYIPVYSTLGKIFLIFDIWLFNNISHTKFLTKSRLEYYWQYHIRSFIAKEFHITFSFLSVFNKILSWQCLANQHKQYFDLTGDIPRIRYFFTTTKWGCEVRFWKKTCFWKKGKPHFGGGCWGFFGFLSKNGSKDFSNFLYLSRPYCYRSTHWKCVSIKIHDPGVY